MTEWLTVVTGTGRRIDTDCSVVEELRSLNIPQYEEKVKVSRNIIGSEQGRALYIINGQLVFDWRMIPVLILIVT